MFFSVQISLLITETFRHPFPVFKFSTGREALRGGGGGGGGGGASHVGPAACRCGPISRPGQVSEVFRKSCNFHGFSWSSLCCCPVLIRLLPLSSSLKQLSVYEEAETTSQDTANESGQNQPQVVDVSSMPNVAKDGDAALPSSILAGRPGGSRDLSPGPLICWSVACPSRP